MAENKRKLTIWYTVSVHVISRSGLSGLRPNIEFEFEVLFAVHRLAGDGVEIPDRRVQDVEKMLHGAVVGRQDALERRRGLAARDLFDKELGHAVHDEDLAGQGRHVVVYARAEEVGVGCVVGLGVLVAFAEDVRGCLQRLLEDGDADVVKRSHIC